MDIDRIQKKLSSYIKKIKKYYYFLPGKNRRWLTIIVPIFLLLLLLPDFDENNNQQNTATVEKRQQIELSVQAESTASQTKKIQVPVSTKWQRYQIKKGDTLAEVFRAHALPETDLYAVAAIEGKDKPVSHIHPGQWIQYKQRKNGTLDALLIEMDKGKPILYFRLSSGDFIRDK